MSTDALYAVFRHLLNQHPKWEVQHDWTYEVVAADGYCVAKCMLEDEAREIVYIARIISAADAVYEDPGHMHRTIEPLAGMFFSRVKGDIEAELRRRGVEVAKT